MAGEELDVKAMLIAAGRPLSRDELISDFTGEYPEHAVASVAYALGLEADHFPQILAFLEDLLTHNDIRLPADYNPKIIAQKASTKLRLMRLEPRPPKIVSLGEIESGEVHIKFSDRNISSIYGRHKVTPESPHFHTIKDILDERSAEIDAIAAATGFTATNIASMFNGAAAKLPEAITALHNKRSELTALGRLFGGSAISNILDKVTPDNIETAIDVMYKKYESEIDGKTFIPVGSKPELPYSNHKLARMRGK